MSSVGKTKIGKKTEGIVVDFKSSIGAPATIVLSSVQPDPQNAKSPYYSVSRTKSPATSPDDISFFPSNNNPVRREWFWSTGAKTTNAHTVTLTGINPTTGATVAVTLTFYFSTKFPNGKALPKGYLRIVFVAPGVGGGGGGGPGH